MTPGERPLTSLYIHIPFCTTKCTYCAFNTYINLEHMIPAFVDALVKEIRLVGQSMPGTPIGTVFLGGGTPTLLTAEQHECILGAAREFYDVQDNAEITLEANPNDLTLDYARALREVGYNRISIGMQSADAQELQLFRRRHDNDAVVKAVSAVRGGGFDNINLDLIYGVPHQTLASWENTLTQALALRPTHFSLYALGIEEDTPMYTWVERGAVPQPDDDLAADMYELAEQRLADADFEQYEISNWSLPGKACAHNIQYWRSLPYIGVGPGAHGFAAGVRYSTVLSPHRYIAAMRDAESAGPYPLSPAVADWTKLERDDEIAEVLLMGFRLIHEGIDLPTFQLRFDVSLMDKHGKTIDRFVRDGLLVKDADRVRLTPRGRLLSNIVFREFV